jgi:small subunit ribosomal protein S1
LEEDPFSNFVAVNERGTIITGTVKEVDAKQAVIEFAPEVEGVLKASEISVDRIEDARNAVKVGDQIEVKIISIDRKNRNLGVSVKAKEMADEEEAVREHREREAMVNPTTIGDLIKKKMDENS